jgi:hypothetical protein
MMDNISNKKAEFSIKDTVPQTKIKTSGADKALIIVDGVEKGNDKKYLNSIEPSSIESISVLKGDQATKKYGSKGKEGVIEIITKTKEGFTEMKSEKIIVNEESIIANNMIIINGQIQDKEKLKGKTIQPKGTVRVYGPNNSEAIKLYGGLAKNGVLVFTDAVITDKSTVSKPDTIPKFDRIFTKVENEAQFPGGEVAWTKYITAFIRKNIDAIVNDNKSGTCRIRFIVDTEGNISATEALTMKGTILAKVSIDAIKDGPKWIPAKQNEHIVVSYREQPITFTMQPN